MSNRTRNLLHKSKIEPFKKFLKAEGWTVKETKGCYEAIRVAKAGMTVIFYKRNTGDHLTTHGRGTYLASKFIEQYNHD